MTAINAIVVFLVAALVDAVWAKYIESASAGRAGEAAGWSAAILICGSLITIEYIGNHWLIVPSVLGGVTGTYLTIKYGKKAEHPVLSRDPT